MLLDAFLMALIVTVAVGLTGSLVMGLMSFLDRRFGDLGVGIGMLLFLLGVLTGAFYLAAQVAT